MAEKTVKKVENEIKNDYIVEKEMTVEEYLNERVPFFAIKDNDRYKDDLVEIVNGRTFQIQRGVHVMIPRFVFHSIENSNRQGIFAADVSQKFEDQFAQNKTLLTE